MRRSIDLWAVLFETWEIIRTNPGKLLVVLVVFVATSLPFHIVDVEDAMWPMLILALTSPIWIALGLWLSAGLTLLSIRAAAGQPWNLGHLFYGGRWIMRFFGINLLMLVPMMACMFVLWLVAIPFYMQNTPEEAMLATSAEAAGELDYVFDQTAPGIALSLAFSLVTSWISAWFCFAWYLAVDKDMPWMEAADHSFKMVRGMVIMLTLLFFLSTLPRDFISGFPISNLVTIFLQQISIVLMSLITAILYRERLRDMEAEGGQPLGRRSILSLPVEDEPWETTGEIVVEKGKIRDRPTVFGRIAFVYAYLRMHSPIGSRHWNACRAPMYLTTTTMYPTSPKIWGTAPEFP